MYTSRLYLRKVLVVETRNCRYSHPPKKVILGQQQCFLASHTSGNAYLYNENLPCNQSPPVYQIFKQVISNIFV